MVIAIVGTENEGKKEKIRKHAVNSFSKYSFKNEKIQFKDLKKSTKINLSRNKKIKVAAIPLKT